MTYDDTLSIAEAARLSHVTEETVQEWLRAGLPYSQQNDTIIIQRADLETFLLQQPPPEQHEHGAEP